MKYTKLVRESLLEGVADIYGEKEFYIDQPHSRFEQKYSQQKLKNDITEEIIGDIGKDSNIGSSCLIIKNPKSFDNFQKNCRGIILKNGDLYVAQNNRYNHSAMIIFLDEKGILNKNERWFNIDPNNNYITVQRVGKSNKMALGESNHLPKLVSKEGNRRREEIMEEHFRPYYNACQRKNPQFKYILDVIFNMPKEDLI